MPHGLHLSRYVKEAGKPITISVSLSQYQLMERFASITNRTIADVASQIFVDHTLPKIQKLLDADAAANKQTSDAQHAEGSPKQMLAASDMARTQPPSQLPASRPTISPSEAAPTAKQPLPLPVPSTPENGPKRAVAESLQSLSRQPFPPQAQTPPRPSTPPVSPPNNLSGEPKSSI